MGDEVVASAPARHAEAAGSSTSPTVTVAVLGTGSAGMRQLAVFQHFGQVVGVPRRATRRSALERLGYMTAGDLNHARQLGASACVVATDTGAHARDGLLALSLGCEVLMEKPLAVSAEEGAAVVDQAERLGRQLFVGCVLRFSESLARVRQLLPLVGPVHTVRIECQSYLPDWRPTRGYQASYSARALEGGVLLDLIHEIDYAGWLFGWPDAVQARLRNLGRLGIQAEEAAELLWESPTGALVSISLDYLTRPPRRWMRAAGRTGTIEWDGIAQTVTLSLAAAAQEVHHMTQLREAMYVEQAAAFLHALRAQPDERLATGRDGLNALAVCDAARRAAESGGRVPVRCR